MNARRLVAAVLTLTTAGCAVTTTSATGFTQTYSTSPLMLWSEPTRSSSVPPMAADRIVNEVDCTRPIENPGGNIKCKAPPANPPRGP